MIRCALLLAAAMVALGASASLLHAQHATPTWPTAVAAEWSPAAVSLPAEALGSGAESSFSRALVGATVGGFVAPAVGGIIGNAIAPREPGGYGYPGLTTGVALGLLVGPSIGAYMGNQRQGNPALTILGATAGTVLFTTAVRLTQPDDFRIYVVVIPATQIGLSAALEYVTGR